FLLVEAEHLGTRLTLEPGEVPGEHLPEELLLIFPITGGVFTHATDHALEDRLIASPWCEAKLELPHVERVAAARVGFGGRLAEFGAERVQSAFQFVHVALHR